MGGPHDFGRLCEETAASHLVRAGWRIIARNYRFGHREIDIIARRGRVVAFVEVKGRRTAEWGHPLEAVTARKRREIERVAAQWVARFGRTGLVYRFDAIAVVRIVGEHASIEHVEDAWRL
jgi:putative endonuclease